MRNDARIIIENAIRDSQPDSCVKNGLESLPAFGGRLIMIAVGKAAWQMAKAATDALGNRIDSGVMITKYGHAKGDIPKIEICEAGHPVPDENTYRATQKAMDAVKGLTADDCVLFLLSGGASALFEYPLIDTEELEGITRHLLAAGADIVEINTLRKRFSAVKGGKFARLCRPAKVFTIALSDVLGDRVDMIGSGPTVPDSASIRDAQKIADKYAVPLSERARTLLNEETVRVLDNSEIVIGGSVRLLCDSAVRTCEALGYQTTLLTNALDCEAREAGAFLASIAKTYAGKGKRAFVAGGETVVHLTGKGRGGRNQELALSAARGIAGLNALCFSVGSDGTDGPTDAAGGIVTGETARILKDKGINIDTVLRENDSYNALAACDGLIMTGPTGTNVNDVAVVLVK